MKNNLILQKHVICRSKDVDIPVAPYEKGLQYWTQGQLLLVW